MRVLERWFNNHVAYFDGETVDFSDFAVEKRCLELYGIDEETTEIVLAAVVHELEEKNR